MITLSHVRGVVFDLDDTLYPELEFVRGGFQAVTAEFPGVLGPAQQALDRMWRLFHAGDRAHVFDALLVERCGRADRSQVEAIVRTYRTHPPQIALHPDADRLLTRLAGRAMLGLVSDGPCDVQQRKFDALNLTPRLHSVEWTDLYGREFWKPHPRAFEAIARRLGCPHAELAYVADNPEKDFLAPNRLGWTTIQIRRPDGLYRDRPAPPAGEARHAIESLDDLSL